MSEQSFGTYAKEFKKDISSYIDLKLEYSKLILYEKIARISAISISSLVVLFFSFFVFLFVSISIGFYLGEKTGSNALGFGIISLLFLLILMIILLFKKKYIENTISEKFIEILMEEHEDKEKE